MGKKKYTLTITVFAGYVILGLLMALAGWFIYHQVVDYTQMTERSNEGNQKLLLVGEAATKLYEAESLSRQLIQNIDQSGLELYTAKIDSIKNTLASLQNFGSDSSLTREIDSINILLSEKTKNLRELLELRARGETDSYYSRVLNELQRVDQNFESRNYNQRFKDLEPHQRQLLIKLLEYSREQEPNPPALTIDSLVNSVKTVLGQLETQERRYRNKLHAQEDQLLSNEIKLNNRLRILLSTLEAEERQASLQQVEMWQNTVEDTTQILIFLGAASLLVILTFILLVTQDVSRSQRYRKQLEAAKTYAESLLNSREQFMNTVTHDLRSPLNTVIGYTGLLEKSGLNKSQNRYLKQLQKSSNYLLHLVNDLLDISRLEAGKMSVEKLTFNPKHLLEETVENAVPPEKSNKIAVEVQIAPEVNRPVITDPFRLKQIITNLVSNACKFTPQGSVTVSAWLEEMPENTFLCIEVKDTGIGISKEQKEKVFEEFSQENTSIEKKFGGTGLGLAISKKLTHLLKGKISLESEPGEGSSFLIEIPVVLAAPKETPEKISEESNTLSRYTVLLVDDEPAQLGLLKELIKHTGMSYRTAPNGEIALKKVNEYKPNLILTDIQMPVMDGIQLLNRLKNDYNLSDLPVVALSGQAHVSASEYSKMGFSGSLLKPYSSTELIQLMEELLEVNLQKTTASSPSAKKSNNRYSLTEINAFAGDDQEALHAILSAFIESTHENLEALSRASQKQDKETVSRIAHKMLPMFRQLKVASLVKKLSILENADGTATNPVNIENFIKEARQLLEDLEGELKA